MLEVGASSGQGGLSVGQPCQALLPAVARLTVPGSTSAHPLPSPAFRPSFSFCPPSAVGAHLVQRHAAGHRVPRWDGSSGGFSFGMREAVDPALLGSPQLPTTPTSAARLPTTSLNAFFPLWEPSPGHFGPAGKPVPASSADHRLSGHSRSSRAPGPRVAGKEYSQCAALRARLSRGWRCHRPGGGLPGTSCAPPDSPESWKATESLLGVGQP